MSEDVYLLTVAVSKCWAEKCHENLFSFYIEIEKNTMEINAVIFRIEQQAFNLFFSPAVSILKFEIRKKKS